MSLGLRTRELQSPPMIRARSLAPGDDVGRPGDQRVHEAGAGRLHLDGRARELQPVLHQAGRRGKRHVRREGGQHHQVDVARIDAGVVDAAHGRLVAQVAGGLVRQGVAAFQDAGALDDPVGVEAEALVQVVVGDDGVGDVAAGAEDADAHQTAAARARQRRAFFAHESNRLAWQPAAERASGKVRAGSAITTALGVSLPERRAVWLCRAPPADEPPGQSLNAGQPRGIAAMPTRRTAWRRCEGCRPVAKRGSRRPDAADTTPRSGWYCLPCIASDPRIAKLICSVPWYRR